MKQETKAIHTGQQIDPHTGAIVSPIHMSSTFQRDLDGEYSKGHVYSRYTNPNRQALEQCMADLEGGIEAAAFSSGSAAMMTLLQTLVPGDHVIAPDIIYFGIMELMKKVFSPLGIRFDFVDMSQLDLIESHITESTKLIIVETPSNPQLTITDIKAVVAIAKAQSQDIKVAVDNTIATPILQLPLALGADYVIHATTKYIAGHSDVLGGMVITKALDKRWEKLKYIQKMGGAVPSPFECWLTLRGIQTMSYRVRAMTDHAKQIAAFLQAHPKVESVLYPGIEGTPFYEVASRQMKDYGVLMSFLVKGDAQEAIAVTNRLKLITRATSFGGTHSLIEHRHSVEAEGTKTPENLLRLSIGLEHVDDLTEDLEQGLR